MKTRLECMGWGAFGVIAMGAILTIGTLALRGLERTGYYAAVYDCKRFAVSVDHEQLCGALRAEHNRRFH